MSEPNKTNIIDNNISIRSEHVQLEYHPIDKKNNHETILGLFKKVEKSWEGCLSIIPINSITSSESLPSLRQPQISALFKILAHFTDFQPSDVTVVMPTGTGKTETMLAAICALPVSRSLIIVPTDSLREQTFKKLLSLGLLRELNVIKEDTLNPVVALIKGGINSNKELELLINANVIVATPQSLKYANEELKKQFFNSCSHLFFDEAHHIKANTWVEIKRAFKNKPIVQFTATPFREDRQKVGGEIIYNYPMSLAQKHNIFRPIKFISIYEVNDISGDIKVAHEAVSQLKIDISNNFDHILMARCSTQKRANDIFKIYDKEYSEFKPILIHSKVKKRKEKLKAIVNKEHRIIICVDMLGEGFDLPELKVCALHDIHKSLAITLQFAGRFVRDRPDLGNPTFIANICDRSVESVLKDLYIEDPDWNKVLQRTSESTIQKEINFQELVNDSIKTGLEVPLENLKPALSTLIYKANSINKNIDVTHIPLDSNEELVSSITSQASNLTILLTRVEAKTKWAPQSDFSQFEWRLIVIYYIPNQNLIFIHDSSKSGFRKKLVEYIGKDVSLMKGDSVFKCFAEINRLVLQNAGLNRGRKGPLRYIMYTGIDIEDAISDLVQSSSYKSNFFGKGYEKGNKVSIGGSHKGRIWSMNSASISDWMIWCENLGRKLLDDKINPNEILNNVLRTKVLTKLPQLIPIGIDWPDSFFEYGYSRITLELNGKKINLDDTSFDIIKSNSKSIYFSLSINKEIIEYKYTILASTHKITKIKGKNVFINVGSKQYDLEEFFNESTPVIYLEDGTKLFDNLHIIRPDGFTIPHIPKNRLSSLPWNINIRKESQGTQKNSNTIQYYMIQHLIKEDHWIIFDDDGPNEIADIVTFKDNGSFLAIDFYHLKFSKEDTPGARIGDFYEVCGQVIKGCKWVGEFDKLITQLKKREKHRINTKNISRIEKGEFREFELLKQHASRLRKEYNFHVVQPGLNISNVSDDILALLGAINLYVQETTGNSLNVIGSI